MCDHRRVARLGRWLAASRDLALHDPATLPAIREGLAVVDEMDELSPEEVRDVMERGMSYGTYLADARYRRHGRWAR